MSDHRVDVVRLGAIEKHPNADTLGLCRVFGYTCAVRLGDFNPGDLVAYIPPDSMVPATEPFTFLGEHRRIKVKRLRGVYSQGLIVRAPAGTVEGDDAAGILGIEHYEPPVRVSTDGMDAPAPSGFFPVYDVESWRRFGHVLVPGERVMVTEKIHGASARYLWDGETMHVGSHRRWLTHPAANLWSTALQQHPSVEAYCRAQPGICVYAEAFGQVQDLRYDTKKGEFKLAIFDLWDSDTSKWLEQGDGSWNRVPEGYSVPLIYEGPYHPDTIESRAEGKSNIASHLREGCVIRAVPDRVAEFEPGGGLGRVQFKIVGNGYLERA